MWKFKTRATSEISLAPEIWRFEAFARVCRSRKMSLWKARPGCLSGKLGYGKRGWKRIGIFAARLKKLSQTRDENTKKSSAEPLPKRNGNPSFFDGLHSVF